MQLNVIHSRRGALLLTAAAILVAAAVILSGRESSEPIVRTGGADSVEGMAMGGMNMSMGGSVLLTADQIRRFGITFGTTDQRTLETRIRTVGVVTFDETRIAEVAPKFGGFVERLYVDFTGQAVRAGQPLVEIYSPELVAAQEELLLATRLDQSIGATAVPGVPDGASRLTDAARRRLQLWDISAAQIDQILQTGQIRRTLTLYAPVAGVVVEKRVVRGQATQAGQTLYTIADLSEVWIEAELREQDAGSIQAGTEAIVEFTSLSDGRIRGRVDYIYPTFDVQARTLKARIRIPNPDGRLKPGMYATVHLSTPTRSALTVPAPAIVDTGERQVVFVDLGGGRMMSQEVEVGSTAGGYTEILAGLEPGQRVVTSAQYLLDSESNMAEVMRSMIGSMGAGDMGGMDMGGMNMSSDSMGGMRMEGMR